MGEAGFGAEEQASRHARRVARLRAQEALGESVDAGARQRAERQLRNWSVGAEGERAVADSLAFLARYGWTSVHDVHWPGRPQANIDHIAVGPGGVVVIDAKNWSGDVVVNGGTLRQNGYSRTRESASVVDAAAAVTVLLAPQHRTAVRAVLCLAGQDQEASSVEGGAVVVGRGQLPLLLLDLPARLSVHEVSGLAHHLERELGSSTSPSVTTTAALTVPRRRGPHGGNGRVSSARGERRTSRVAAPPARAPRRSRQTTSVGGALLRLGLLGVAAVVALNLWTSFVEALTPTPSPSAPVGVVGQVGEPPVAPLPVPDPLGQTP